MMIGENETGAAGIGEDVDPEDQELRRESERIAQLIEDLGALAGAPVRHRAEELVRRLLHLYGEGLRRLVRILAADPLDAATRVRLRSDALVSSLLVLHAIHPDPDAAADVDPGPDPADVASDRAPELVQIDLGRGAGVRSGKRGGQA